MIAGVFDWLVGDDVNALANTQRGAINADIAAQRAALARDMERVGDQATTAAAVKIAVAGFAVVSFAILLWKLANRNREVAR